jgi:hypothetical protein
MAAWYWSTFAFLAYPCPSSLATMYHTYNRVLIGSMEVIGSKSNCLIHGWMDRWIDGWMDGCSYYVQRRTCAASSRSLLVQWQASFMMNRQGREPGMAGHTRRLARHATHLLMCICMHAEIHANANNLSPPVNHLLAVCLDLVADLFGLAEGDARIICTLHDEKGGSDPAFLGNFLGQGQECG